MRTRHACSESADSTYGISTSSIQEFNPIAMSVKTRSGKTYSLVGQPEKTSLGEAAWRQWCGESGVVEERDVTDEYLKADQMTRVTFKKIRDRWNTAQV
jgi:hypothetical protein